MQLNRPFDAALFTVPRDFGRVLGRDLAAAGIPKRYGRGGTLSPLAAGCSSICCSARLSSARSARCHTRA